MPRDGTDSLRGFNYHRDISNDLQDISKTLRVMAELMMFYTLERCSEGKDLGEMEDLQKRLDVLTKRF